MTRVGWRRMFSMQSVRGQHAISTWPACYQYEASMESVHGQHGIRTQSAHNQHAISLLSVLETQTSNGNSHELTISFAALSSACSRIQGGMQGGM